MNFLEDYQNGKEEHLLVFLSNYHDLDELPFHFFYLLQLLIHPHILFLTQYFLELEDFHMVDE